MALAVSLGCAGIDLETAEQEVLEGDVEQIPIDYPYDVITTSPSGLAIYGLINGDDPAQAYGTTTLEQVGGGYKSLDMHKDLVRKAIQASVGDDDVFVLTRTAEDIYGVLAMSREALADAGDGNLADIDPVRLIEGSQPIAAIAANGPELFVVACEPDGSDYQCTLTEYQIVDHELSSAKPRLLGDPWQSPSLDIRLVTAGTGLWGGRVYLIKAGTEGNANPAVTYFDRHDYYRNEKHVEVSHISSHDGAGEPSALGPFYMSLDSENLDAVSVSPRGNLAALSKPIDVDGTPMRQVWYFDASIDTLHAYLQKASLLSVLATDTHVVKATFEDDPSNDPSTEGNNLLTWTHLNAIALRSATGAQSCSLARHLGVLSGPITVSGGYVYWPTAEHLNRWSPDSCMAE